MTDSEFLESATGVLAILCAAIEDRAKNADSSNAAALHGALKKHAADVGAALERMERREVRT
ncbi:hypothetical protein [Pararhodobacter oceanensis]|uniref:hypothetical protein n=1 Tax=Pararhodobacter oceanensis TaxID=2172121 RepID=UPI003A93A47F